MPTLKFLLLHGVIAITGQDRLPEGTNPIIRHGDVRMVAVKEGLIPKGVTCLADTKTRGTGNFECLIGEGINAPAAAVHQVEPIVI
jgi:hypothetical protein